MFKATCIPAALAACLLLLTACAEKEASVPPPDSRPVKLFTVAGGENSSVRNFPGRVDAAQRAELAFRVSGQLQRILVKEGDMVDEGQLLARLDPTDYQVVLEDRQASFDNAERNFQRGKELVAAGNISRTDYDRMEANYRSATAALSQAKNDLEYTELRAPFRGRIAQRLVENFEEVLAKQTVFFLQNIQQLEVQIDLPESLVRSLRGSTSEAQSSESIAERRQIEARASFQDRPGIAFPLQVKEIATRADDQTQTYRVTFSMQAPDSFAVLPGMSAQVSVDFSGMLFDRGSKWVPSRAVQGDAGLGARVWVLDPDSMTVNSRPVEIGRLSGNQVEVVSGLQGGEEIVAVGAPYLAEGMKVTRMAQTEQAQPRADDPA